MKLVLMSTPNFFVEEHHILTALFDEGLELVHLNKPNSEPVFYERLLSLIPQKYRKNIITHDHFYLQNEYGYYNKPLLCFMNGMFPENKRPRLYAKMKSIRIINGYFTDLKINKPVYDIEFELIKE